MARWLAVAIYIVAMIALLFCLKWAVPKFGLWFFVPFMALIFLIAYWVEARRKPAAVEIEPPE
jgi:hypothetical protein